MDIAKYRERQTTGTIGLARIGAAYVLSSQRFDPSTGKGVLPEIQAISREDVLKLKAEQEEIVRDLEAILSDMDAADAASDVVPAR